MNGIRKIAAAALLMCLPLLSAAGDEARRSFAIVIDKATYAACRADVDAYRDAVSAEGFDAFVEARSWSAPEEVSGFIKMAYGSRNLAGAVFVGDIPIVMVNRAQHLTSAFKMDQKPEDLFNTTVPSDRFYDDFDLEFDYISSQDTLGCRYYYYNLAGRGSQEISCDIFSGRIKPTLDGEAGYSQLRSYLQKVVAFKKQRGKVDRIVSFTGHGSFSNSLIAWKDETITLQEQFPDAFRDSDGARFYFYSMYPDIKRIAIKELRRPDLDLALFHEHGVPDTQYVGGEAPATGIDGCYNAILRKIRSSVARRERLGSTRAEAVAELSAKYGLDSTWFATLDSPEARTADSLHALEPLIMLPEVDTIAPNARITLFDACYNGDFREKSCIASAYIFSKGNSIVSLGNSVNVLQDKSSSDLLGLLACGYPIGQICQMTNILESHIIGDPTMRFDSDIEGPDFCNEKPAYWKDVLAGGSWPCEIRSLALYKLYALQYDGMGELLQKTYADSREYTLRLECLLLSQHYPSVFGEIVKDALDDPYEFIRRKAVYWCGEIGDPGFAPLVAKMYMDDYMALRLQFNISTAAGYFGPSIKDTLASTVASGFPYGKEDFLKKADKSFDSALSLREFISDIVTNPETKPGRFSAFINSVRNSPDPALAQPLIAIAADSSRPGKMRIDAAEALGWYVRYQNKGEIISACQKMLESESDAALADELLKTVNRLKAYSR